MRLTTLNRYLIEMFRPERDFDPVLSLTISVEPGERILRSDLVMQPFWPTLEQRTSIDVYSTATDGQMYRHGGPSPLRVANWTSNRHSDGRRCGARLERPISATRIARVHGRQLLAKTGWIWFGPAGDGRGPHSQLDEGAERR